jgi:hypothetical protein
MLVIVDSNLQPIEGKKIPGIAARGVNVGDVNPLTAVAAAHHLRKLADSLESDFPDSLIKMAKLLMDEE